MESQVSPGFLDFIGRFQTLFQEDIKFSNFEKKIMVIRFNIKNFAEFWAAYELTQKFFRKFENFTFFLE